EVKGFGRVLDATTFLALLAETDTATAAHDGSAKELDRVRKLNSADANVSAQAVETAEAAEARDRAAVTSARMRMNTTWGRELSGAAGAAVSEALDKGGSLVRLDILPGEIPAGTPKSATVQLMGSDETYAAEILGSAPTADPQMQGTSYVALVRDHMLPSGAALRVAVTGLGENQKAFVVPRTAIVYHQGSAWIYVLGEEDTFFRRLVTLGRSTPDGVVITEGATEDEQVAITGAQQLLSAELQAGGAAEEE
ncbi:MAG: metal transporter, partial [Verrucomicrobia bacterium]|nr:metal transporter [Verrucomicrobiota bacterium]